MVCSHDSDTVVLAHLNGGGMGMKASDLSEAAWACANCHRWLDFDYAKDHTREQRDLYHLEAVIRTISILEREGVIGVLRK